MELGENMKARHKDLAYMLASNHLILTNFVLYFSGGEGEGVCTKDLEMLQMVVFHQ